MKKYKTKFPVARIKKIMQADEDVGKMSQATPVLISKALELFLASLVQATSVEAKARNSRRLLPGHLKVCIETRDTFDFLKDTVSAIPALVEASSAPSPDGLTSSTKRPG
ncbi:histone-fold-containing protein, partial [Piptocephalis cylindrospora]